MVEVIVEYDYIAKEPDELTIKKGDIIKDVVKKQGGWWEGALKDKKGMFPDNFVRQLDKDPSVVLRNKKDVSRIRQCRVVFSYNQDHEDELNLNVGDIIDIIGEEEEGWWRGTLNGKEGVFPSNFVEEIAVQPKPSSREDSVILLGEIDLKAPKLPAKPTKQLCEVRYPYKAQNEDELTMKEGDIITLLSRDSQDPGWWRGELNGRVGVFPDNFVTLIPGLDEKGALKDDKKSKIITETGAIKPSSIASQRKSLESSKLEKLASSMIPTETSKTAVAPPPPAKKPPIAVKKSPSSGHVSRGIFSEIKQKIVDAVDGAAGSKTSAAKNEVVEAENDNNAFDEVERRPLLADVRATRVKAPGRRPPSSFHKDDTSSTATPLLLNGNTEYPMVDTPSDLPQDHAGSEMDSDKPRLREWEKHRAPWLEEMKLSQAKRTSTSPGRDGVTTRLRLTPTGGAIVADEETGRETKSPPIDKEMDMSRSMPPLDLSKSLSPVLPLGKQKTPPDELEKSPTIRAKPAVAALNRQSLGNTPKDISPVNKHTVHVGRDLPSKPVAPSPPKISPVAPVPKPERNSGDNQDTINARQYSELLERMQKLEFLVERQSYAIEELKNRLQVETDMRMMLQEKVLQNVQV